MLLTQGWSFDLTSPAMSGGFPPNSTFDYSCGGHSLPAATNDRSASLEKLRATGRQPALLRTASSAIAPDPGAEAPRSRGRASLRASRRCAYHPGPCAAPEAPGPGETAVVVDVTADDRVEAGVVGRSLERTCAFALPGANA